MILTEDMKRVVAEQRLGFFATVCPDGTPNLSPKGTIAVWDDERIVFLDLASPGTIENLRANPFIEVNVVDQVVRKGYRFKGRATLLTDGPEFERAVSQLTEERGVVDLAGRVRHAVLIDVEHAAPLISPIYETGASEDEVRKSWSEHWARVYGRWP
jgi:uncharacterized protein